jgi:hypothetical protein
MSNFIGLIKMRVFKNIELKKISEARGHAVAYVVEALCYKPDGRGFDFR